MGEGLLDGIGNAIEQMPPTLAAMVIMGLAIAGLVYAWRKSGEEARRERERADVATTDGLHGKLDALHAKIDGVASGIADITTGIEVLKDRKAR